jgi:5'-nucleotidase
MHILVTNDDGVQAPGLLALTQAMRKFGKVTVLAPDKNWSASGHVKTMHRPMRVYETQLADGTPALTSDGAPSDCVALALLGIMEEKVDLVVSGINPHANIGHDVTYSGTVTAAMEAVIAGIPGIAFSVNSMPEDGRLDYGPSARAAEKIVERFLANGALSKDVLLNVNIPYLKEAEFKGILVTRQGLRVYNDELVRRTDPHGRPYYWIGGDFPTGVVEDGTDYGALSDGYISVTPLQLDLTAWQAMDALKGWKW